MFSRRRSNRTGQSQYHRRSSSTNLCKDAGHLEANETGSWVQLMKRFQRSHLSKQLHQLQLPRTHDTYVKPCPQYHARSAKWLKNSQAERAGDIHSICFQFLSTKCHEVEWKFRNFHRSPVSLTRTSKAWITITVRSRNVSNEQWSSTAPTFRLSEGVTSTTVRQAFVRC
jgi:hypothetical protein